MTLTQNYIFYKYYLTNSKPVKSRYAFMNWAYKDEGSALESLTQISLN